MAHELELDKLRRASLVQRWALLGCLATLIAGWTQATPETVRAHKLEIVDAQGKVRARVEVGRVVLLNSKGEERARLTADETNGNLVLFGEKQKRLEVFMEPQTPRVVFFSPEGKPTLILPPQ